MPSLPQENQTGCQKLLLAQVSFDVSSRIFVTSEDLARVTCKSVDILIASDCFVTKELVCGSAVSM